MSIAAYLPDPFEKYVICTSSTRPSGMDLFQGLIIYETDTDYVLVYNGSKWTPIAPRDTAVTTVGSYGTVVAGFNDIGSGSYSTFALDELLDIPDWADTIHYDIMYVCRIITGNYLGDFRLVYDNSVISGTTYNINMQQNAINTIIWRGSVPVGTPSDPTIKGETVRSAGSGSIRQSLSYRGYDIWFT